jgi:hypothetical protein
MFSLTRQSRIEKAKDVLRETIRYADELAGDQKLRSDVRAAVEHGTRAGERVRDDIDSGGIAVRLTADKKLRKELRAALEDLDRAAARVRRKRSHKVRNALLVVVGAGAAVAVIPSARRWVSDQVSGNGDMPSQAAAV